jgi:dTDP-3,4-didehydro-2,6-dideoxy-alpha-D-glucose 3-reductase
MSVTLRLGVLGCADIAGRRMLPAALASGRIKVTAVASRDAERAARLAGQFGARPVTGYEGLLDCRDVDAVYVPLPNHLHAEWAERALRSGRHVLVEKPLTTSYGGTARLFTLARTRGLLLRENVVFPHHAQHEAVRTMVGAGTIGRLHTLTSTFTIPARPEGDIRLRPEFGGGALLDCGIYPLRLAQLFLGPGLRLVGATLRHDPRRGIDLGGCILLTDETGLSAQLTFGMDDAYQTDYELRGSAGRIQVQRAFTPSAHHKPQVCHTRLDGGTEHMLLPEDDQYANAFTAFADQAAIGADEGPAVQHSLRQAALVDRIRAVASRGSVPG